MLGAVDAATVAEEWNIVGEFCLGQGDMKGVGIVIKDLTREVFYWAVV